MACGTGKTFTSLKIAEEVVPQGGAILFLSPSISLVSQSLTEWTRESEVPFQAFAVCSDSKVGKRKRIAPPCGTTSSAIFREVKVFPVPQAMTSFPLSEV